MKWFSNLKLRTKLLSSFASVTLLALVVGLVGIFSMRSIDRGAQSMYTNMTVPLGHIAEIAETTQRVRVNMRDLVFADDPERKQYSLQRVHSLSDDLDEIAEEFEKTILSDQVRDLYEDYVDSREASAGPRKRVIDLAMAFEDRDEEAIALLNGAAFEAAQAEIDAIEALEQAKVQRAEDQRDENEALTKRASSIVVGVLLVALFLVVSLGLFIAAEVAKPIAQLSSAAQEVADGNVDVSVSLDRKDEIGALTEAFNSMVGNIKTSLETAQSAATQAEHAAKEAETARHASEEQQAYLSQSVDDMLQAMDRFADGDLTVQVQAKKDDEIAKLFNGFNRATRTLRGILQDLSVAVSTTNQTAIDIAAATDQLAAASHEQSSQSSEVSIAVEQMTASIIENARSTNEATQVVQSSGQQAKEGGAVVNDTVTKIREIAAVFSNSSASIERLSTSSQQIGRIVSLINEIAEQTNLLALNAAIEAARAGEHGKSFAVVAEEVRSLASRTREATQEISHMIETIQTETQSAVQAMAQGANEVESGLTLADRAGQALKSIVQGAQETERTVSQIAVATEAQSTTSEEIAHNMETMSRVSTNAADEVNRIAEATVGLRGLTTEIQERIAHFNLGGRVGSSSVGAGPDRGTRSAVPSAKVRPFAQAA